MASKSNKSDKKPMSPGMMFSQTSRGYKLSQSSGRPQSQTPSPIPSSSNEESSRSKSGHPPVGQSISAASMAKFHLRSSNSRGSSRRRDQVAMFMGRKYNRPPKSRLGGGKDDDMPPLEDDMPPQSSSYYYYQCPEFDNFVRHFRDDAPGPSKTDSLVDHVNGKCFIM